MFPPFPFSIPLPPLPTTLTLTATVALVHRLARFVTSDCDMRTLSASIHPSSFQGRVAWVTGASSGIGLSLSHQLAKHGALLILTARRKDLLEKIADSLPCPRSHVFVLPLDLSADEQTLQSVARSVSDIFGRLDFLFNNAGVATRVSATDLALPHVAAVMQLNFLAPVALAQACLPALRENPGGNGTIVNTVSIASMVYTPLRSSYCASKAAMVAYFNVLDLEEPDVRVINLHPGSVRTPIAYNAIAKEGKPFGRTDVNIEAGLDPERCADRMLAAVSEGLPFAWIARPKELMVTRISQAFPALWRLLSFKLAKGYRQKIENHSPAKSTA